MKTNVKTRLLIILISVSLIPMIIIFLYVKMSFAKQYSISIMNNNRLVKESNLKSLSDLLYRFEYVSNFAYDEVIQDILKDEKLYSIEKLRELKKRFTIELDLLKIKNEIKQINFFMENGENYAFIFPNYKTMDDYKIMDININEFNYINLLEKYKYQDIVNIDNEYFMYLREIRDLDNGESIGKLGIIFNKNVIHDIIYEYLESKRGIVFIKNRHGEIIFTNTNLSMTEVEKTKDYIKDYYPFEESGIFVTFYDNKKVVNQESRNLTITIIVLMIISSLLIIAISVYLTNVFVRPIKKISKAVNKVSQGDYNVKVEVATHDELKELADNFNLMTQKINWLINEVYSKEIHEKQAIIAALTSQINPHFLYNTLDMVKSMAELGEVEEIGAVAKALSGMFRYATKSDELIVTLQDEIENLKNYIKIIDARFDKEIDFIFDIDKNTLENSIIKLCLQPIVENAVSHGLKNKIGEKKIIIQTKKLESSLLINIIDNGIGMDYKTLNEVKEAIDKNKTTHYESIGLSNINRRLNLYYNQKNSLVIKSEKGKGTTVTIQIKNEPNINKK